MAGYDSSARFVRVPGKARDYEAALMGLTLTAAQLVLFSQLPLPENEVHEYDDLTEQESCLLSAETINAAIGKYRSVITRTMAQFVAEVAAGAGLDVLILAFEESDEPDKPSAKVLSLMLFQDSSSVNISDKLVGVADEAISRLRAEQGQQIYFEALQANYPEASDIASVMLHHHVARMFGGSADSAEWVVKYSATHDLNPADFGKTWEDFYYASRGLRT